MELVSEGCLELTGVPAVDLQANRVVSYASLIQPEDLVAASQAVRAAGEVKIGLSAPLTGDWAEYGNDFKGSTST